MVRLSSSSSPPPTAPPFFLLVDVSMSIHVFRDASVVPDEQEAMPEVEMGREREDSDGDAPTQVRESFLASIGRKACELLLWRGRGEKRGVDRYAWLLLVVVVVVVVCFLLTSVFT